MVSLVTNSSLQRREDMLNSRSAWTTLGVSGQPGPHNETLSQKTTAATTTKFLKI